MTVGILCEKASAARNFAKALGGMSGTFNGEQYVIAHARGHLFEFVEPELQVDASLREKYKSWSLENLPWDESDFAWKNGYRKDAQGQASAVKQALSGCDELVVACDVDPHGEGGMIAVSVFKELKLQPKKFTRMYFTDEAPASLQKAFKERKHLPDLDAFGEYREAVHRSKVDMLTMQFTRIATTMAMESGQRMVLRQGRLKSAMTALVGDQLKAYEDYVKKPFFQNRFKDENDVMYTNPDEPTFEKKEDVPSIYSASAVVLDSKKDMSTAPPKLLDLAGLSTELAKTGLKPAQVLATYQKLYEAQIVSYPRTEDRTVTPEQFKELEPLVDQIAAVVGVDTALLTHRQPRKTHVQPKGAHGANRPGTKVPSSLSSLSSYGPGAEAIYTVLAKNYLAMLADDYRYEQQKGHVEKYPDFKGLSNVPKSMGWKAVFDADADDALDGEESSKGLGTNAEPIVHEGANKRPEHPSMKWLMKQLEKRDVGTGATRTSTYAEVTSEKVKYPLLVDKRGKLTLADAGRMSWMLLPGTHIGALDLTERVYADMRAVADGSKDSAQLLAQVAEWVREDIVTMQANAEKMRSSLGLQKQTVAPRAEGVWDAAPGGAKQVAFKRVWGGHTFTDDEVETLLAGGTVSFVGTSSAGKKYDVYGKLVVGSYQGKSYVGFQKLGFGKVDANGNAVLPDEFLTHKFSASEKKRLEAGEKVTVSGLKGKSGKEFSADLEWKAEKPGEGQKIVMTFGIPAEWCQHKFTEQEKQDLLAGKKVEASDFVGRSGKTFSVAVEWKEEKPGEGKKIVPDFGDSAGGGRANSNEPPKSWCGVSFDAKQIAALKAGKTVQGKGFTAKSGKKFDAGVKWVNEGGRKKIVPVFNK